MSAARTVAAFAPLACALALAACAGGGDDGDATDETLPPGVDLVVVGRDTFFTEEAYSAPAGDITILFDNRGNLVHDVRVRGNDEFDLNAGGGDEAQGALTLEAGTYEIYCSIPGHEPMKASLTVE
jgi:plastocyanin